MPSKKKDGKSSQQSASWEEPDDVLQAVVLADSFNYRFLPITLEKPRALLPLVNCTLLDYTVDFLISSGVKEIFVFCSYHAEQVINFIKDPQWNSKHSSCTFHTVLSEGCMSLGDAMREIDRQAFIKTDFILVHGDLVSNIKLEKVLKEHKERREKSKSSVMTMIYKPAAPNHKTRSMEDDVFLAIESSSNRILHWEKAFKKTKFSLPLELFVENTDVKLRYDLLDCGINVCSPEVPQLFTDNFDFQTKDDFVRGIITNEEVTGNKIHCCVVDDEYGARITNLQMYDSISKDIIRRWAYPVVPDNSILHSDDTYVYNRHNVYFGPGVLLARDCILEKDVVVGSGSSVGTGSVIRNSVIGKQCVIGYNVVIDDSYIWDGVKIENNCLISKSLLCDNVVVKQNVTTQKGCILSFNVVVGPDIDLRPGVKITLKQAENQDNFGMAKLSLDEKHNTSAEHSDAAEVGSEGRGYVWKQQVDSDEEDEQELIDLWGQSSVNVSEEESSDESMSAGSPASSPPPEDAKLFYSEVLDTVRNGISNKVNPDNLVLEINASKYAYNVTFHELNHAVTKTFLECIFSGLATYHQDVLKDMKKAVSHFQPLFAHYMKEAKSQKVGILAAEEFFIQNEAMSPAFQTFLHLMYDREVFDENVILAWFNSPVQTDDSLGNEIHEKVREQVSRFITWLQEAEEEESDN